MCPHYIKDPKYDNDSGSCPTCQHCKITVTPGEGLDIDCPYADSGNIGQGGQS